MVIQSKEDSPVSSNSPLPVNTHEEKNGIGEENVPLEEESQSPPTPYLKGWRLHWIVTGWDLRPSATILLGSA